MTGLLVRLKIRLEINGVHVDRQIKMYAWLALFTSRCTQQHHLMAAYMLTHIYLLVKMSSSAYGFS
jgi:hypothetical protein